ncbi:MAG: ribosome-associated translation inhibitor RaiA [Syntrophales bacterium]|jgi:putative sigma-54 modulation protein|nr:ribosome-associated translation inhibitor RaiA [Syntrophales bacterium]MDY0043286.1 ribosome-associated translation inhibitor RaiA [Syntrophales bacterium]
MQISFTFRNADAGDGLKEYVTKKVTKLERYIDKPVEAKVVLSVEKYRNVAEINLIAAKGAIINGKEEAKEMIVAIDTVIDKIERQLKKHKEKIRKHKDTVEKGIAEGLSSISTEGVEEESSYKVVEIRKIILNPMSVDDAILQMEESNNHFVMFRDAASENVSVIYRRDDGNYELIQAAS